jgi:hypothetical protein
MGLALDHRQLYRLPWSLPDNAISWLEPTEACNLYCLGCYRANNPTGHKNLEEVGRDLDVFQSLRKTDGVSIAGGDPLTHPEVVDIVAMVAERGLKPILNTNGRALTPELLAELKRAGLLGLTFHMDSKQRRPDWKGKSEVELNELRLRYAQMVAEVGGLSCAFNATVYGDTLQEVPEIVAWGQRHIDIVHVLVFIAFRAGVVGADFDYFVGGEPIDFTPVPYAYGAEEAGRVDIASTDIVEAIRSRYPDFQPCAYLNGTARPDSFKWLLTLRVGTRKRIYGYAGPKFMELAQTTHHFFRGRYLAYAGPRALRSGRSMLLLSPLDRGIASAAAAYLGAMARNPLRLGQRLHAQSIMAIQPIDVLPDGRQNMCDGCPDMTVWEDGLAWSCRLEEPKRFGSFVQTVPKGGSGAPVG